jgi:Heterokaryon incompatibility protein (HET)
MTSGIDIQSRSTESSQSFVIVEDWIRKCHSTHSRCNRRPAIDAKGDGWLPTRLLDVFHRHEHTEDTIRLVVSSHLTRKEEYTTLSYCWGRDPSFTKLLSLNLSTFQTGLPVTQLPKTFREAVQVTRRLGYRYLWIDALCIIQDSPQDWLQEALSMSEVYASSALNLAAAASGDADGGLFRDRNPARLDGCDIPISWKKLAGSAVAKQSYHVSLFDPWSDMLKYSPLHKRGWAFQERLLSPRTLHFAGDQIYWECFDHCASELYPVNDRWGNTACRNKEDFAGVCGGGDPDLARNVWDELTAAYSHGALTYSSDKLVALSGIAAQMARAFK